MPPWKLLSQYMAIIVFVVALCLPVATAFPALLGDGESVSAQEKRQLNPWPGVPGSLPQIRRWPEQFSRWFDDRFGYRDQLIDLHNYGKAALGISPSRRVVLGHDGWVFIDSAHLTDANRGARPFAPGEAMRLADYFLSIQTRLAERGIPYIHVTPPDKQSLFREFLPRRIRYVGPSRYSEWRAIATASRLNFVDIYPDIRRGLDGGETLYMQTDSHWNCQGAYVAYRQLMAKLNALRTEPVPVLSDVDVKFRPREDPMGGDLVRNSLGTPYLFPESKAMSCRIARPANATYTALEDGKKLRLSETYVAARPSRTVNHEFPDGPRALVFRDSYTNAMIPFLNRSFGEVVYVAHRAQALDESLIDELEPDVVIVENIERTLVRFGKVIAEDGLPISEGIAGDNG